MVTGCGMVTPFGLGVAANTEGFRTGQTAFRPVTSFDVSRQRVRTAAQVNLPDALPATTTGIAQDVATDTGTPGREIVPTQDAYALVAYLMSLDASASLAEAPVPAPPVKSATAVAAVPAP